MPRRRLPNRFLKLLACFVAVVWRMAIAADGERPRVVVAASADAVLVTIDGTPFTASVDVDAAFKEFAQP